MHKLWTIIEREYLVKVRMRSFKIMTFVSPIAVAGIAYLIYFLIQWNTTSNVKEILVLDQTGQFETEFHERPGINWRLLEAISLEEAKVIARETEAYALLYVPKNVKTLGYNAHIRLYSKQNPSLEIVSDLENRLSRRVTRLNLMQKGLAEEEIERQFGKVKLKLLSYEMTTDSADGAQAEESFDGISGAIYTALGFIAGYLIMMFVIIYGNMVMRSAIEEKSSRVIEIIVSSVRPFYLMLGKLIGTSLVGLTQFLIWVIIGGILFMVFGLLLSPDAAVQEASAQTQNLDNLDKVLKILLALNWIKLISLFIIFFLLGFLLYGSLYIAIGAAVDSETDTQQFMMPIILPLILAIYVGFITVVDDPNNSLAVIFSYIPFTSPIVMLMRIPFGVPWWEYTISIILLLVSIYFIIKISGKIYKNGILKHDEKASFKQLFRLLKAND